MSPKNDKKRERDQQRDLREMLARMPDETAKRVRKVCQDRGLLPGGVKGKS